MTMKWTRSLFRAATFAAAFGFTGCDCDCDCAPAQPVPPAAPAVSPAHADLSRRIVETQLLNGAWGFTGTWYEPIDYTYTGLQNVTGVTAFGLFDAYQADLADDGIAEEMWFVPGSLAVTKDYIVQWMKDFVDGTVNPSAEDPMTLAGVVPTNVSIQNFTFCRRYDALFGLSPSEASIVNSAFDLLLANRDATYGTDPAVVADGHFNRTVLVRTAQGIPGVIGWDVAGLVRALLAMNSPQSEIDWVVGEMKTLPSLDVSLPGGLLSIAHVLTVLNLVGDTSMNETLLAAMQGERNLDGSYGDDLVSAPQTTSFCLMALKTLGLTSDAAVTQAWLDTQIHAGGFVYDSASNTESYEAEGEMLWSLIYLYH